ncbi:hypothetical protein S101520_03014 [Lactiplantibacillus plantarum subsp. plantarum]|nr:hypothetical protein S101520_03014 [Lactiplantibacillus plantarum subsp. plantarum]
MGVVSSCRTWREVDKGVSRSRHDNVAPAARKALATSSAVSRYRFFVIMIIVSWRTRVCTTHVRDPEQVGASDSFVAAFGLTIIRGGDGPAGNITRFAIRGSDLIPIVLLFGNGSSVPLSVLDGWGS